MWSSRLFRRLFLAYAGVNAAAVLALFFVLSMWQQAEQFDAVERRLLDAGQVIRRALQPALVQADRQQIVELVSQLATKSDLLVTVLSLDGTIVADSISSGEEDTVTIDWVEFDPARSSGQGRATRLDRSLGRDVHYLMLPIGDPASPLGYVRVASSDIPTTAHLTATRRNIWLVFFAVTLANLVLSYWAVAKSRVRQQRSPWGFAQSSARMKSSRCWGPIKMNSIR